MNLKFIGRILCCFTLVFLFSGQALAHKVTVFAWVEGNQVFGECKFSGGKRAKNAEIIVWDSQDNELLRTRTDANGQFSYTIPKKSAMRIELVAGMGHKGEWKIPIEELGDDVGTVTMDEATPVPAPVVVPAGEDSENVAPATVPSLSDAQFEAMVERAVDKSLNKKLKPVMTILADMEEKGPSVNDVMGGIGYIFGLAGVAAYFKSRQKKG